MSSEDILLKYTNPLDANLQNIVRRLENTKPGKHDLDDILETIVRCIKEAEKSVPRVKYKQHIKPYWNEHLSVLKRNKISSYRLWCSVGRPRDALDEAYIRYKQDKKIFAKTLRSLSVNYENQEILDLVRSCEMNRNFFWKKVKRIRSPNNRRPFPLRIKTALLNMISNKS